MVVEHRPRRRTTAPATHPEAEPHAEEEAPEPLAIQLTDDGLHFIQHCLKLALEKLEKYRLLMEETVVYWAAHILHPGYGLVWINQNLPCQQQQQILHDFKVFLMTTFLLLRDHSQLMVSLNLPSPQSSCS